MSRSKSFGPEAPVIPVHTAWIWIWMTKRWGNTSDNGFISKKINENENENENIKEEKNPESRFGINPKRIQI